MAQDERGVGSVLTQLDSWTDVLDEFESTLDHAAAQAAQVGEGSPDAPSVASFTPPASMPPFPVELEQRARGLVARHEVVVRQVEAATAELRNTTMSSVTSGHRNKAVHRSPSAPSFDAFG